MSGKVLDLMPKLLEKYPAGTLVVHHGTGKVYGGGPQTSGGRGESMEERLHRIRAHIERLNQLMSDIKRDANKPNFMD